MGAVFESLKCADIPNFEFSVPPIDEQRAIARVLGALDDKIELNRRMNRTLEELAAALFRSWFVDFDPVVVKAAGRKPPTSVLTSPRCSPSPSKIPPSAPSRTDGK
jgi:type I restriction enzyme S subunit